LVPIKNLLKLMGSPEGKFNGSIWLRDGSALSLQEGEVFLWAPSK
jgi:hypothetical protein